jgi:hypothetical protein
MSDFISYIGPPELHDSHILGLEQTGSVVRVLIQDYNRDLFTLQFSGVSELSAVDAEGMVLYALAEVKATAPRRKFVFANWDEDSDARLEITAEDFCVSKEAQNAISVTE